MLPMSISSSLRLMTVHLLLLGMCLPDLGFLTSQGQTSVLTGLAFSSYSIKASVYSITISSRVAFVILILMINDVPRSLLGNIVMKIGIFETNSNNDNNNKKIVQWSLVEFSQQ